MMLLLSGEGPTDLGSCTFGLATCENDGRNSFESGVLTVMLDKLIEAHPRLGYSLRSSPNTLRYLGETELNAQAKARANARRVRLRGTDTQAETGYYEIPARTLGQLALELEIERGIPVVSLLFRDSDGTNSAPLHDWKTKFDSMVRGFESVPFERGVPMLPKPKSEAWLICAAKKNQPYQHCAALEEIKGNDIAQHPAKQMLEQCFTESVTRDSLVNWMEDHIFQSEALANQMPSFKAFKEKFDSAISSALAWQHPQANPL